MKKTHVVTMASCACACGLLLTSSAALADQNEVWFASDIMRPTSGLTCGKKADQGSAAKTAQIIQERKTPGALVITTEANNCHDYYDPSTPQNLFPNGQR